GALQFWDAAGTPQGERVAAHDTAVTAIALSPDSQTIARDAQDSALRLWDPSGNPRATPEESLPSPVSDLAYTPEGNLVTSLAAGDLQLRDPQGRLRGDELPALPASPNNFNLPPGITNALQGLPRSTWWIIPAIPILLILVGLLWSIFGGRRSPEDPPEDLEETDLQEGDTELMDVPAGNVPARVDDPGVPDDGYLTSSTIPPDSAWVGVPAAAIADPPLGEKLSQAKVDLAEGNRLASTGHYDDALNRFNDAIEAAEVERMKAIAAGTSLAGATLVLAQATASRGNVLALLGRSDRALESFNRALEMDADTTEAWIGKGRLLANTGQLDEALFCFDKALELDPSSGPAWAGKGRTLIQMGQQQEGQTCLNRAAELGGDGEPMLDAASPLKPSDSSTLIDEPLPEGSPDEFALQPFVDSEPTSQPGPLQPAADLSQADVPAELQQVIAELPSAETLPQPAAPLADPDVPASMQAVVAALPDEPELPEHAFITADQINNPDEWEQPIAPVILEAPTLPSQPLAPTAPAIPQATLLIDEISLPDPDDLEEMAEALRATIDLSTVIAPANPFRDTIPESPAPERIPSEPVTPESFAPESVTPESVTPDNITPDTALETTPLETTASHPAGGERPTGRVSLVEFLQPTGPDPVSHAAGSENAPAAVDALESEPDLADSGSGPDNTPTLYEPPVVESEPVTGDTDISTADRSTGSSPSEAPLAVDPPAPEPELGGGRPDNPDQGSELADLPPEVLAALRGIPADSPDYLDLPNAGGTPATAPPPVPANPRLAQLLPENLADLPTSWMTLDQEPDGNRLYTVWEISDLERAAAKQKGGETLMICLYDVTGQPVVGSLANPIDQQACYELAKDWYLALPDSGSSQAQTTRTYVAEVGYQTNTGEWLSLARSSPLSV
ncbi:MAG: tetratricopeptide repeat protein, partial [Cyanobacteria bacterium Co-bin13]|nr:tetratricopeptide repeat protein [Cyanobacteria bacterium Co-bin13]